MINKDFQKILSKWPNEYIVCVDNALPWEVVPDLKDPTIYVNTDIGQIEVYAENTHGLSSETVDKIIELYNIMKEDGAVGEDYGEMIAYAINNGLTDYKELLPQIIK